ncbi:hypothetical protein HF521_014093 [Silurus meridionalis]|uniref:Uncharacterized protein n=1 Tax=Silurus meridionalis TaxID=175797 RepID=A0A8T0AA24_SILME|nr:hypothetical protein HF521_014093 [Silurus meridionalis]
MKTKDLLHQPNNKENVKGFSFKMRRESQLKSTGNRNSFPEGSLNPDYKEQYPHRNGEKYNASMKTLIPIRFSSSSNPIDDAGFFSFTSFSWMMPMMWKFFRNHQDNSSFFLSPHDRAHKNGDR